MNQSRTAILRVLSIAAVLAVGVADLAAAGGGENPGGRERKTRPVLLHLKGMIDGSQVITIDHQSARWQHLHWGWPTSPVTLADVAWTPREQPILVNDGATRYLHQLVDFSSATMRVLKGRDLVALEVGDSDLRLVINDSLNGAAEYELVIAIDPLPAGKEILRVTAEIDGTDQLLVERRGALWSHRHWSAPSSVTVNGVAWDLEQSDYLPNRKKSTFLSRKVDFGSARIVSHSGRDTVSLEQVRKGLLLHFGDSPNGRARYEVVIALER